jgi:hypothetical protein
LAFVACSRVNITFTFTHFVFSKEKRSRGAQIPGAIFPWQINVLWVCVIFVSLHYGTCFLSPLCLSYFEVVLRSMENLCSRMLTATFTVKPLLSHSAMDLPSVYDENSLLKYKRGEHICTVHCIMKKRTVYKSIFHVGNPVLISLNKKGKFQPRTGHKDPDWDQIYSSTLS